MPDRSGWLNCSVQPRWANAVDGVTDGTVLAFAVWTLWYELALKAQLSLWWPARIWVPVAIALMALCALQALRAGGDQPAGAAESGPRKATQMPPYVAGLGIGLFVLLLVLLVSQRAQWGVVPIAVVGSGVLVAVLRRRYLEVRSSPSGDPGKSGRVGSVGHWVVAGSCLLLALLASLLLKSDADDVYYVNRATWVAEHGIPTIRDTIFGEGVLPSTYLAGPPLPSVEGLLGALAHVFHLSGATMSYVVVVPPLAAAVGWATWRLVRSWSPRQPLLVYLGAITFMLLSADSVVGNYSVGRIWQGKVMAFAILIPLIWCHLSVLVVRPSRWSQLMLFGAGISFVGLTSTAALLAPVIVGAALLAACILRSRALAVGAGLLLVAPLTAGLVVALGPSAIGGEAPVSLPAGQAFTIMLGTATPMVVLGLVGTLLSVWLVPGRLGVLAACGSLASMVALFPGVFDLVNAATGAGPVAWRLLLGVPTGVLVGNLLSIRGLSLPSRAGSSGGRSTMVPVRAPLAVGLVAILLISGTPLWSRDAGATLTSHPTWKVNEAALEDVRRATRLETAPGLWLMPPVQMEILGISSTRRFAVVPRRAYLPTLDVGPRDIHDRAVLFALASGTAQPPGVIRSALNRLKVTLACVSAEHTKASRSLSRAVDKRLIEVGAMVCHVDDQEPRH